MAGSLSQLQCWLHYIDDQLSPEAVEHLKLGLHSEFFRYYSEVEKLDKPSLLYYFLLERCKRQSESQALKIFLHVVRGLGGALRGNLVISKGFGRGSMYSVNDPGLFDIEQASVNFKFFQCLLKISTKARTMALGDQLKKKFAKGRFLNTNYRHIKTLPDLFIRLYQKGVIAGDNTHHLVEALSKYKAWVCLQILNSYHKSVGLQPVSLAQKMEKKFGPISYSSSDPSSMEDSISDATASEQLFRKSFYEGTELDSIDMNNPMRFSYVSTVHSPIKSTAVAGYNSDDDADSDTCIVDSVETEKMIKRHKDAATGQLGENKVVVMSKPSRNSKLGRKLLLSIIITSSLLLTISIMTLLVEAWIPLWPRSVSSELQILNGSTIIVKEIDSVFHKTVNVGLSTELFNSTDFYDSTTNIDFYGASGSCDHIYGSNFPIKTRNIYLTDKNISSYIPEYALKGSIFNYKLSGNVQNISDVDFVDVCVYRGSDYNKGTLLKCKKVLLRQDYSCGSYEVRESDYYFFKVDSSGGGITDYELHIDESVNELHVNTDECKGCRINTTNDRCQFLLPLKMKFCLMAEFYPTRLALASVTLDVVVKDSRYVIMLVTPLSILSFVMLLVGFVLCVPMCYYKYCKTSYSMVTIV